MNQAHLGFGRVWHKRLRPVLHEFAYPAVFLMLPLRSLRDTPCPALSRNRRALFSFHDADHGEGGPDALAWLDATLQREGIVAAGEVWLLTLPRVLGYAFKPVSFWWAHRTDGSLAAVVAEVNNTFGERHCYLLEGEQACAAKVMHVSPFCEPRGAYRFRLHHRPERGWVQARVDHDDEAGPLLHTSIGGHLQPLTRVLVRALLWRAPGAALAVSLRIHWQALRLWLKRVPVHRRSGETDRAPIR